MEDHYAYVDARKLGLSPPARVFDGTTNEQMPYLVEAGLELWSPAQVMRRRTNNPGKEYKDPHWLHSFNTNFGIAATEDTVYLFPNSDGLRNINLETMLVDGGVPASSESLSQAKSYDRKDVKLNACLSYDEAVSHPLWLELADGNKLLLRNYSNIAFSLLTGENGSKKTMRINVPTDSQPIQRAVVLYGGVETSLARGIGSLDIDDARLVGVPRN